MVPARSPFLRIVHPGSTTDPLDDSHGARASPTVALQPGTVVHAGGVHHGRRAVLGPKLLTREAEPMCSVTGGVAAERAGRVSLYRVCRGDVC